MHAPNETAAVAAAALTSTLRRDHRNPDNAMLQAALALGGAGFPVFPVYEPAGGGCACGRRDCDRPAKHPRTPHGLNDATMAPAAIRGFWRRWPAASIGLEVPPGHVVLDLDDPAAAQGLGAAGYTLPSTATARTARGLHLWYTTEGPDLAPAVGIFPHVDLRAPGSYVVAPPSRHISGAVYTWVHGLEYIAPAPEWLYELARPAGKPGAWREALKHPIAEGEGRNAALASFAGVAFRWLPARQAVEFCSWLNERRFRPPLEAHEFEAVVHSIAAREVRRRKGGAL